MFDSNRGIGAAVYDDGEFFIGESGQRFGDPSDYLVRIGRDGGVERLAGPFKEIDALTTRGSSVYFMLSESPNVMMVPEAGGSVRIVARGERYDPDTGEQSLGLWAHPCGLLWLHGNSALVTPAKLEIAPWSLVDAAK